MRILDGKLSHVRAEENLVRQIVSSTDPLFRKCRNSSRLTILVDEVFNLRYEKLLKFLAKKAVKALLIALGKDKTVDL